MIYVDMDGTLVNFAHGMCNLYGIEMPTSWPNGFKLETIISNPWAKVNIDFWINLLPCTDAMETLIFAAKAAVVRKTDVVILSMLPSYYGVKDQDAIAARGKLSWLNKHRFKMPTILTTICKSNFTGPDDILIDDCENNINAFNAKGGLGILVPRPWNSERKTLSQVFADVPLTKRG